MITQEIDYKKAVDVKCKDCKKCGHTLSHLDYGKDKRQKDGMNRFCKPCHRENCSVARAKRRKPCVYQLFFTDGSTYIGSTTQNFNDRLAVHRAKAKKNTHTNTQFNRYEPEDITGHILMVIDKEHELRMNEYVLIKHFKNLYGARCLNAYAYTGIKIEEEVITTSVQPTRMPTVCSFCYHCGLFLY